MQKKFKNYISPDGFERLRSEWEQLKQIDRPEILKVIAWAAGNGDRSENADYLYGKKRLREIDSRLRFLGRCLDNAEVVNFLECNDPVVRFGATVTVVDEEGVEHRYRIVGKDEIDTSLNRVSWLSPIGKGLMGKAVGEQVQIFSPNGDFVMEIIEIRYRPWD